MGCAASVEVECPKCNWKVESGRELLVHLESRHDYRQIKTDIKIHSATNITDIVSISCPKCKASGFTSGDTFLDHLETKHQSDMQFSNPPPKNVILPKPDKSNSSLPKVGDRVLAMWGRSKWQYFHATIRRVIKGKLQYEIDWDDEDSSGRIVDYYNLAVDKIPLENEVGAGSVVLFHQGTYKGREGVRAGGVRWHQGRITKVYTGDDGIKRYDGCHTKGAEDGKWVTFKGYEPNFEGYEIDDFRVGPNVFDIVAENSSSTANNVKTDDEDVDIYFSFTQVDCPKLIKNGEVSNVPETYLDILEDMCDPVEIANQLKMKGIKVAVRRITTDAELKDTVSLMKKAKVFVACISDQYVANDQCRMEFQFAKKSLFKPIVPLVVGDGSFEWTVSVVGMLIAGELYIHFKDKSVVNAKMEELFRSLRNHLPEVDVGDTTNVSTSTNNSLAEGPADVFISYCWTNSFKAEQAQQILKCSGTPFSDPRLIKSVICDSGYSCWLDIERLHSANNDAGMYEQLTKALRDSKMVLACISKEYANSANCRMEFQFAMKSLRKDMVPIVVGESNEWEQTVIGALVSSNEHDPVDLQHINDETSFEEKMEFIKGKIEKITRPDTSPSLSTANVTTDDANDSRLPKVGDRVLAMWSRSLWQYFHATIKQCIKDELKFEIEWDDGDSSGRIVDYYNLAIDRLPSESEVGVGSIVLFHQGRYKGREGVRTGGVRWHQGEITRIYEGEDGSTKYAGHHTKGAEDGKWVTFKGYEQTFEDYEIYDFRVGPNVFDIVANFSSE